MIIYDKVKRFNPNTGEPVEKWSFKEMRCDYTGEVVDVENMYCMYGLDYEDQDPCFGSSGAEYEFGKDFKINVFDFLSGQYHFKTEVSYLGADNCEPAEKLMMQEALKNSDKKKSEWYRCTTFDAMCRQARIKTARRLIEDKVITPEQLEKS